MLPSCFAISDTCKKVFPSECVWSSPLETRQYVQCAASVYLDPLLEWRVKKKEKKKDRSWASPTWCMIYIQHTLFSGFKKGCWLLNNMDWRVVLHYHIYMARKLDLISNLCNDYTEETKPNMGFRHCRGRQKKKKKEMTVRVQAQAVDFKCLLSHGHSYI